MGERKGDRSGLRWLFLFGGLLAWLFLGLAVTVGFGSPQLPPGAVAVIEGAPPGTELITRVEIRNAVERQAQLAGSDPPKPGSEDYENAGKQALSELITVTWLAGQAAELGLRVGGSQEQLSLPVLQEKVRAALTMEAPDPSDPQPYFTAIDFKFPEKWLPRTQCRDGFVVEQCGNFVSGHAPGPCYEAEPKEPVEACPASVMQRAPALPGTVTEKRPWGTGLPQRPYPEVAPEGEVSGG